MRKGVSMLLALCLALTTLTAALPTQVLALVTSYDLTIGYTETGANNGIVDRRDTAFLTTVTRDGMQVLHVEPNPDSEKSGSAVVLDHYSYKTRELSIENLKSISFYCFYEGTKSLEKATLHIMPSNGASLTATVKATSRQNIKKGEWAWVEFDLSTVLQGKTVEDGVLAQFHFYPYGSTVLVNELETSDVVNIAKIRLSSTALEPLAPTEDDKFLIGFRAGRADVTGDPPQADAYYKPGDTFRMPKNTYSLSGYTFSHFICTADTNTYNAATSSGWGGWWGGGGNNGSQYTVPAKLEGAGRAGAEQAIYFIPVFKQNATTVTGLPDVLCADFTNYYTSVTTGYTGTANVDFDGRKALMIEPIRSSANGGMLYTDGWSWDTLPWNLDYYKYVTIEYYFDTSDNVLADYSPQLRLLTNGGALWEIQLVASNEKVVANKWSLLSYDLSGVKLNSNVASGNHVLKQMHYWLTPENFKPSGFAEGSKFYIGKITLYHTKPSQTPRLVSNYMNGDASGVFRPHDKLTRAETAQLFYNIIKNYEIMALPSSPKTSFRDVSSSDWFYTAVANLETLGILPKGDTLSPNSAVTRGEFAVYLQNVFYNTEDKTVRAGLPLGGGDTIKREEAVSLLNKLVFGELCWELSEPLTTVRVVKFKDVHPSVWSYNDIVAATAPRISLFSGGRETPLVLLTDTLDRKDDPEAYDTAAGDAKILEIDDQTAARVAAIRATPNTVDPSTVTTGKVYYLSTTSGSSASPGTSASLPRRITSLDDVSARVGSTSIKAGDVLLFKRGDTFRGKLTTVAGVTYSSYGEGPKPVFIRNTEEDANNPYFWTLDYEDPTTGAKIWKYYNTSLVDVGAINLIGDDGTIVVAYKEIPSYKNGTWWVRGKTNATVFDYKTELDRDLEFVQFDPPNGSSGNCAPTTGPVYLRCDKGNPGSLYSQIEFNLYINCIRAKSDVTIDNICIKFFGSHGIGTGSVENLTVTNCEIGWGGGAIQYYSMGTTDGNVVRYGNGIEIYGGLKNYTIDNCYVYQIYDAGITHQISATSAGNYIMQGVNYTNNVLEYSTYNIEYFMSQDTSSSTVERYMKDVSMDGNIVRKAGYGWGVQRTSSAPSNIKGWASQNKAINFSVTNNILDRTYNLARGNGNSDWLAQVGSAYIGCDPYMSGNTFVQVPGRLFACDSSATYKFDTSVTTAAANMGAANNAFYFCSEGAEEADLDTVYRGTIG